MPNVNYRGKLPSDDLSTCEPLDLEQQDPDVLELDLTGPEPRDSQGMSSVPLDVTYSTNANMPIERLTTPPDPWPPLSREQVVELREALADFLSMMENGYGDGEVQDAAHAATRLESKLLDLGLGMLPTIHKRPAPPVRPFTQEQAEKLEVALAHFRGGLEDAMAGGWDPNPTLIIYGEGLLKTLRRLNIGRPAAKMSKRTWTHEEVQSRAGLPQYMTDGVPNPTATELAIMESMGRKPHHPEYSMRNEFKTLFGLDPWMRPVQNLTPQAWKEGTLLMVGSDGNYVAAVNVGTSPADVPRRQEGQWEEAPKRNCGTCRNVNLPHSLQCAVAAEGTSTRRWLDGLSMDALSEQMLLDRRLSTADNCPGWEPKS